MRNENPKNIYAKSKAEFDNYIRSIEDNLNINVTGLRYFNVYGPNEHHKNNMSSVILKFFNQMKSGSSIKIFKGSKTFLRDFVFVEDVIDINIFFYKNRQTNIFNVGTSVPRSFREIAEIFKSIHKNLSIEEIDFPSELKGKYQKFTKADNSKINKVIPNLKYTPLEEGVKKYNKFLEEYSQ
jgi:ADP-L-glycero-D-manno-heptose 6-epimerase